MQAAHDTTIRVHPERSVPDEFAAIMEAGDTIHVAFCIGAQPHIIPLAYHFDSTEADRIYVHGRRESRVVRHLAGGASACICVTLVDGYVYSRNAMTHSMNYRSAIAFGRGSEVTDLAKKRSVFTAMTRRYIPGRTEGVHYQAATDAQLEATLVVAIEIEASSAKARRGGATGPSDADPDALGTCGVIEKRSAGVAQRPHR